MNNHPGYPSPGFPTYGRQHQVSSDSSIHGPQRLPNHDAQEFSRNEILSPYSSSFRKEASAGFNDSSSLEGRQTFSSEETNSYRPGQRQYRLPRDDIFSGGRLSQIDRRTLLQSAPRTNFLNEPISHSYSSTNKLDPKSLSFSTLKQNQPTSNFKSDSYSNISRNMFSKEDVPYDNLPSSGSPSNMQKFGRDFSYQNEQSYAEPHSHFKKVLSNPVHSKNASFTNRTFSGEQSSDTSFSHNSVSSPMSYFKGHNFKHQDVHNQVDEIQRTLEEQRMKKYDERIEEIQRLLEEQKRLRKSIESDNLNNLQSSFNSLPSQMLPKQLNWYKNDIKDQSETPKKTDMFYSESSQPSDNALYGEFSPYSQPSVNKTHEIHGSDVLNFREPQHWNNSLESQNTCVTSEKMAVVPDLSHKLSSDFTERRSDEIITSTIAGVMSPVPIVSSNNTIPLKVDGKVNFDEKFVTKEKISDGSQNYSNKNLSPGKSISETSNIENNLPLHGELFNNNSFNKNLELSASYLTIPPENLSLKDWTGFKSSDPLNKNLESKNYSPVLAKSVPTNKLLNCDFENSLSTHDETSKEHSLIPDAKVSLTDCSTSLSLEDNLNKCLEIMKNYSPILIKKDGLKSESLSTESNSNECFETTKKISPNLVENLFSDESSKSAPIPFLNEANNPQSLANVSVKPTEDLSQESESSNTPSFNSVITNSREISTNGSALEDALATLNINSPVVGLDYIVEDKNSLSVDGRFPFKCKLCNSSIARTLILDHIQGSKHRLRYLKIKDGDTYDRIMRQKDQHSDQDFLICTAAAEMEHKYGRGRVVLYDSSLKVVKKVPPLNVYKVSHDLTDVDFESSRKPDVKDLESDSVVKTKIEEQVTPTFHESVVKVEDDSSMNSVISSSSASLPKQSFYHEKKGLKIILGDRLQNVTNAEQITEDVKIEEQSGTKCEFPLCTQKQINQVADSPLAEKYSEENLAFKRSSSHDTAVYKNAKIRHVENLNMDWNSSADFRVRSNSEPPSNKDMATAQTAKSNMFNPVMLEQLSKCDISSEDEAGIVLQTVEVLLKLLLRYKLKDNSNIDVEEVLNPNLNFFLHEKSLYH